MANIKSQIKRIRTNEKARLRNKSVKSVAQDGRPRASVRPPTPATASAAQRACGSRRAQLDKAASKGVIHANQAANKKSAMAKRAAAL